MLPGSGIKPGSPIIDVHNLAIEWFVEDRARYARLVGNRGSIPTRPNSQTGKPEPAAPAIVTVVMEAPLAQVDAVTTALRGPNVRPARYLPTCAEHADAAGELSRRTAALERALGTVAELARQVAAAATNAGVRNQLLESIDQEINRAVTRAGSEVQKWQDALNERKVDVAAELLARIPDEPGR